MSYLREVFIPCSEDPETRGITIAEARGWPEWSAWDGVLRRVFTPGFDLETGDVRHQRLVVAPTGERYRLTQWDRKPDVDPRLEVVVVPFGPTRPTQEGR